MTTTAMDKIHVMLVDGNVERLKQVKARLSLDAEIAVVASARSPEEALRHAQQYKPDVILIDDDALGKHGLAASEPLIARFPQTQMLLVVTQEQVNTDYLRQAMRVGVHEFLIKPFSPQELTDALRRARDRQQMTTGETMLPRDPVEMPPVMVTD